MAIINVTVSVSRAKSRCHVHDVILLCGEAAFLYRKGLVVERIEYAGRGFFIEDFRHRLACCENDGRYLLLRLFSNSLYLSFFYPIYKRIKVISDYASKKGTKTIVFLDPILDTDVFPITGAEGDNTYNIEWDRRVVLKYLVEYFDGKRVETKYSVASKMKVIIRRNCIFVMKFLIVSLQMVLSHLCSKNNYSRTDKIYVVRDERTVRELDIPSGSRILFNPSFRCYKQPKLLIKYFKASEKITPKLYSKKSFFKEFQTQSAYFYLLDNVRVDVQSLAIALYREHYEKICYYGGLKKKNINADALITPEFIGPIAFLESRALFGKVKMIAVQTFALDVTRVTSLPRVDVRTYSTMMDKRNFSTIENSDVTKVKNVNYVAASPIERVQSICVLTQPNFNMDSGIKPIIDGLISYARNEGVFIKLRIHPRDTSDYSEYIDCIDAMSDPRAFIKSCDLVVGKTTSMINDALLLGVPFVTFAGSEYASLPYTAFEESRVKRVEDVVRIAQSINEYIAKYRKFQEVYFSPELNGAEIVH
ncbi:hypothetical protein QAO71_09650 [Halopseudomonas sp. SMJS2]|uniref:hypothetical protein n=1 Tax=Halopseudomonas sp. SMJS2 TaxID=3041098 RepID=UPI0024529AE6|nr:hypothetical protein [Halopseudomonas sp. SMJS2]WGK60364.1 hypothetical protein QAO71_09650 [Halopseudomonas sp. SMJS2]